MQNTAAAAETVLPAFFWHIQIVAGAVIVRASRGRGRAARRRHPAEPRVAATLLALRPGHRLAQFAIATAIVCN